MPVPSACPGVDSLKRFRLGLSPEAQVPPLEQHLASCASCLRRLATLTSDDALVQGLRAQRDRPRLNNPVLAQVQQALRSTPYRAPVSDPPTPSGQANLATIAAPPVPDEVRPVPARRLDSLEGVPAFLAPPKGTGEIGWLGPFRVLRVLGEGGMGVVLKAEDSRLQRLVALKVMKPELASDTSARQRFLREARATAALEHEHIIAIHHIDEYNGAPYLAMPLLQGESLDERLRREAKLPLNEVLRIGRETARGLAAAHEKGLIHRDIKPGNLWLEAPTGRVKVLDFGLASMPSAEGDKTLPGTILGTPGYMAPEQTEGVTGPRADLFSLGCLLYRMSTGRLPFKGETLVQKIRSTLFDTPEPPQKLNPALPAPLCQLIERLMARKPEDRPVNAQVVARVLETIESQVAAGVSAPVAIPVAVQPAPDATVQLPPAAIPVAAVPPPVPLPLRLPAFNRRWLMIGGGSAAALLLLVLIFALASRKSAPSREDARAEGEQGASEETRHRRPVPSRKRAADADAPSMDVKAVNYFPETWVVKSEPISGLNGWSIEADGVGQYNTVLSFQLLANDGLAIRYGGVPSSSVQMQTRWMLFNPRTQGLDPATLDGYCDSISPDTRTGLRCVTGGVQLWEQGSTKAWTTLRSTGPLFFATFSPDGARIATFNYSSGPFGDWSNELGFWDAQTGNKLAIRTLLEFGVRPVIQAWSPDGKTLATSASNGGIALFNAPWKEGVRRIPVAKECQALAWSPDGKYLAAVEADKHVHILEVEAGKSIQDLDQFTITPSSHLPLGFIHAWSPDSKELAFPTDDKKVIVWNLEEKKVAYTFTGHTRQINAVAFLPDNKTLVSGSQGSVRFWDLEKNRLRGSLLKFEGDNWVAIGPEGNFRCSPDTEKRFVYKVRESNNRLRDYSPDDFHNVYGWKNHPERVKLTGE